MINAFARPNATSRGHAVVGLVGLFTLFFMREGQTQQLPNPKHADPTDRFAQIDSWLPTPNAYRTASGSPGPQYWQQRADYEIDITLDDDDQTLTGVCRIQYHNRSPESLDYIWVQLDQNRFDPKSDDRTTRLAPSIGDRMTFDSVRSLLATQSFDGGFKIKAVTDANGRDLAHLVHDTMMRVDLETPLRPEQSLRFDIAYSFKIVDSDLIRARSGFETFEEDGNRIYEIAQWYPRVAAFTDYTGWQHQPFLGRGEFTLELGDYIVRITCPDDMVVAATGTLQNPDAVLEPEWSERLDSVLAQAKARQGDRDAEQAVKSPSSQDKPAFIITPEEAEANESSHSDSTATWVFHAENVRDFAFAASRKFIWDAMAVPVQDGDEERLVMAMSYYPNEGQPLWHQYSTESIAHTIEVYNKFSFAYPYEVAISVNGPVYGMEYPMICFNGPRPEEDGTYTKATKYGLISVVIHEVGHNYFPMIVNSDERQWTWMDEGLNTFLQFLAEQEWEEDYPSRRGPADKIVPFMLSRGQRPIMTGSDEILQFGSNAYAKPAAALNILRETVLGRERFDAAFRHYARRWKFKRPTPADFFRSIEDASGADLDWFWRGWFFSTDHVDLAIEGVEWYVIDSDDPDERTERQRREKDQREESPTESRNRDLPKRIDWQPGLKDFYNSSDYDPERVTEDDRKAFEKYLGRLDEDEKTLLKRKTNFYVLRFKNEGGLVMPIPLRIQYTDGSTEDQILPADIWRSDSRQVRKLILSDKEIQRIEIDPRDEIADASESNNHWPPPIEAKPLQAL
ncbi:MAG: M1 family metallopeptidase [Planctomycetota bacterium]